MSNWIMPKTTLDNLDKILVKSMDFLEFLSTFTGKPENRRLMQKCENHQNSETRHFLWLSGL